MSGNKKKKQCPYNEWVYCRDKTCDHCGWKPDGRKKRGIKFLDSEDQKAAALNVKDNGRKRQKNNTSGHTGVYWDKRRQKWKAEIYEGRERHHLGCFDTFEDAVAARREAEEEKRNHAK